jgi:hypothetical protein
MYPIYLETRLTLHKHDDDDDEVSSSTNCLNSVQHVFCAVLGYYAAYSGNTLPTFLDNLSVAAARVKKSKIL